MPIAAARTLTRRIHERARRAAGLLALALLASLALLPPAPAEAQTTVWSATLTVDEGTLGTRTYRGCDPDFVGDNCATGLNDDDFVYAGTTFDIVKLLHISRTTPVLNRLDFELDSALPALIRTHGTLTVGTTNLSFSSASFNSGNTRARWNNSGLSWTNNQSVAVSLTLSSTVPTLTPGGITHTGARLTITNHTAAWWYKGNQSGASCTSVPAATTHVDLTGLAASTSHTYRAYSASGCAAANQLASSTFTTLNAALGARIPTNVRAVPGRNAHLTHVILHWDRVPGATSYHFRHRVKGGEWLTAWNSPWWTAWNGLNNQHCTWPCHGVWLLDPSTEYEFQVRARRYAKNDAVVWTSGPSATVSATTGVKGASADPDPGPPAAVSLSVSPDSVDEGLPVEVTATLSKARSSLVVIPLAVTNVTSEDGDYRAPRSIAIAAGSTTGSGPMYTARDADGDDETFRVGLDTANLPSGVGAGPSASATVTITDTATGAVELPVVFPGAPATVRADPGDGSAVLTWSAVASSDGWEVQQGDGAWTATGGTAATHTVTGLTNGTEYTFRVRAVQNLFGIITRKGNASAGATVTAGAPAKPDAVASVRVSHKGSSLAVSWDAPARATHYDVGLSADGGATWTSAASNRAGTGLTVSSGIASGTSYTVRVRARNAGGESTWTSSASVSYAAPAAPASVSVTHNGTSLAVSWPAASGAESYGVAYSADGGGSWQTATPKQTGTSLTVGGVDGTTSYTVRVRARNAAGDSAWTASAAVRGPGALPDPVASVNVTHNGTTLSVSWTAPAGATHYDVTYTDTATRANARAAWNRAGTSLTITCDSRDGYAGQNCVAAGATYTVGVRARNANGESAWVNSGPASPPAPTAPPDAVAAVTVVHNGDSLSVSWEAPARATHYDVTYDGSVSPNARAAWNRAGTSLTITCDVRDGYENQNCVNGAETYHVGVRARNAAGTSAWVDSAATAVPAPGQGEIWFVTPGAGKLDVYVLRPARTASYEVRTKTGGGDCSAGTWGAAAAASHSRVEALDADLISVTGLTGGTAYCVQVRAAGANGAKGDWSAAVSSSTPESALSVADASVNEPGAGDTATLDFVVTLTPASSGTVTVAYATGKAGDTATKGSDYTDTSGTLTFAAGQTSKTVSVPVLADSIDDGGETLTLTLSNASGATISDAEATGTIVNDGPLPKAWTARFGRTVADQVIGAVEARMQAGREPGAEASLAGERIGLGPLFGTGSGDDSDDALERAEDRKEEQAQREALRLAEWLKGGTSGSRLGGRDMSRSGAGGGAGFGVDADAADRDRTMAGRELLLGSSFSLTAGTAGGGSAAFWGRGAVTRFDGREGETSLDGEVATAMLGADWSPGSGSGAGRATMGLILGHSIGDGGYRGASGGGTVSSTLTGLYPWGRYAVSERVSVWGVAGWGEGTLELTPENADGAKQATLRADLELAMGAAGLRGTLLDGGADGFTLTAKTDAMAVRTSTGRGKGADGGTLAASEATVTRLRLGLEASRPVALDPDGAILTPFLEVGVRRDGGDAETGFGVDLGGGLAFADPALGLEAELRARGLLTHEAKGFRERGLSNALHWRQKPDSDRGARLSLTQTVGREASGGADALLSRTTLAGLAANDNGSDDLRARRLEVKFGYGLSAFSDRFTLTPEAGAGFADTGRDYRLGLRLTPAGDAAAFELSFEALRREAANPGSVSGAGSGAGSAEHEVGVRLKARW